MKRKLFKFLQWLAVAVAAYLGSSYRLALLDDACIPARKQGKAHVDYYFRIAKKIPWDWTSRCLVQPPIMIAGNSRGIKWGYRRGYGPKPIPDPGQWQLSIIQVRPKWPFYVPYVAVTFSDGMHYRAGARWDDVDGYYVLLSLARRTLHPELMAVKSFAGSTTN